MLPDSLDTVDVAPSFSALPDSVVAELNEHYDRLDALRGVGQQEPPATFTIGVSVQGKRFAAFVETPQGRKVKAGTHSTERAAWLAAQAKADALQAA